MAKGETGRRTVRKPSPQNRAVRNAESTSGISLKKPPSVPSPSVPSRRRGPFFLIPVFFILAIGLSLIALNAFQRYSRKHEQEIAAQLDSIAHLKVSDLTQWRNERFYDASLLGHEDALAGLVLKSLQPPTETEAVRALTARLKGLLAGGAYDGIRLLDDSGKIKLSLPSTLPSVSTEVARRIPEALRSGKAEIVDFYREGPGQGPFLSLLVPFINSAGGGAVLALRIDPAAYLYPYISRWPVPTKTGDILIVRRDGEEALLLSGLRSRRDSALNAKIRLDRWGLIGPDAQGPEGLIRGKDDRGTETIGYARPVPDSPWTLIVKIDRAEALLPLRKWLWPAVGMAIALLFVVLLAGRILWLRQSGWSLQERTAAAQSFHLLSSRQEALLAALPEIIMEVDRNKVYIWANRPGLDFFGDDVIGKEAAYYFVGEQDTYQVVEPVFAGFEDLVYVESWQRRKDGENRLLAWWCLTLKDLNGQVTGAISSARDITDQRKAEDARRETEARYRTLVDSAPIAILVNMDGKIDLVNEACVRLFGAASPDQLIGRTTLELFHPDFHPQISERVRILREQGRTVPMLEEKILRLDGTTVDVEVTAAAFRYEGKNAIHVVLNDITERKLAESRMTAALEALKASEEKFRKAFTTSPDAVNINRMSDGMYVSINKGFAQTMGYREDEIIGRTSLESDIWVDPEDRKRLVKGLRKDGFVENLEALFRKKNGEIVVGLMSAALIEIGGVPHILSITRDISERKRAETALKESEAKFRSIFENIQDVYFETSLDGRILEITPSIASLSEGQMSREDLIGKSILDFYVHPEAREIILAELARKGRLADYEVAVRNLDGSILLCAISAQILSDAAGRPEKITGTLRNVGERKKAEAQREAALAALRENEAIFSQFMDNSPVYMFFKDENIRAIRLSANYKDMLGIPVERALGKTMDELFPSEFARKIVEDDMRILREGKQVVLEEELNGRFYTTIKFPIRLEGKPRYLAGFTIDITERKLAEDRTNAALKALRVSLREKELLLQEVHHRVKNNLQIISSLFNLEAEHASEETRQILKRGQTRIRSLSLVHEKLYHAADLSRIDLSGYIQSLATHLFHVYLVDPSQVRLETDFEEVSLDINSAIPCGLILNELIANSLKHAFPNGRKGVIRIRLTRAPMDSVELEVSDDGVGLPAGIDFRNPAGFGYQIVNLLIDQLEATVSVDRSIGTSFTVKFKELKYKPRI